MRVLVTGSRQVLDQHAVYRELDVAYAAWTLATTARDYEEGERFILVHGGAPGADSLANQWAFDRMESNHLGIEVEVHVPDWGFNGPRAGLMRNTKMVHLGADLVIAFFQKGASNIGTTDCVNKARDRLGWKGVPIKEVWTSV